VYNPGTAEEWKSRIAERLIAHGLEGRSLDGPITMENIFILPRPKSHLTSKGRLTKSAPVFPTKKPDVDNLAKAVFDVITQLGVIKDDSQIVHSCVVKVYSNSVNGDKIQSGAIITLKEVEVKRIEED